MIISHNSVGHYKVLLQVSPGSTHVDAVSWQVGLGLNGLGMAALTSLRPKCSLSTGHLSLSASRVSSFNNFPWIL